MHKISKSFNIYPLLAEQFCAENFITYQSILIFLSFRIVRGGNNICDGEVSDHNKALVAKRVNDGGFGNKKQVPCLIIPFV